MSLFRGASGALVFALFLIASSNSSKALDLDWHGQFRAEDNTLFGYTHNVAYPSGQTNPNNGYTVPYNGDSPATFQNLFLRLDPRVLVNDNISIHSDIWLGTPDKGAFGNDASSGKNAYSFSSTSTGNASITANSLYSEVATDFGTFRVGRMPLNWGLGLVWKADNKGFDRLPSSGDGISLVTKFGAFKFMPAIIKYQNFNQYNAATYSSNGGAPEGNAGASDYVGALMYTNDDEQVDLGVQFMRRVAGINSNVLNPFSVGVTGAENQTSGSYAYNIWDFYVKKKLGAFKFEAEVPLANGLVAGHTYSTVAGAIKVEAQANEHWKYKANIGTASGQGSMAASNVPTANLSAFAFNPDYRPGFLMFNYNYRNIADQTGSPYDNPVTDARFLALQAEYDTGKWSHGFEWLYAIADTAADGVAGNVYFNTYDKQYQTENAGVAAQSKNLGWEVNYAIGYDWDESIHFGAQTGLYFPGGFYDFNNSATPNSHKTVFGTNVNMMVRF